MIIINDFFVRYKEAVSNQMELILKEFGGKIIAATRFMNQKSFQKVDRDDHIFIYPPFLYGLIVAGEVFKHPGEIIHVFEEEPCWWKELLFNIGKNKLYVSMYRRPDENYAKHLKKYRHLCKVFVELEEHKTILKQNGIDEKKICVTPTPAKIPRHRCYKNFELSSMNILFASWNNKEKDAIYERGLQFLLEFLKENQGSSLTIPLRDNDTASFLKTAEQYGVCERVQLIDIGHDTSKLIKLFDTADFVAFVPQKRIVKDVPNSLIDGLMRGKPLLISDVIDFSKVVLNNELGFVYPKGSPANKLIISKAEYDRLSKNAYQYASHHLPTNYISIIRKEYHHK